MISVLKTQRNIWHQNSEHRQRILAFATPYTCSDFVQSQGVSALHQYPNHADTATHSI
jgi:hypothetical protein